MNDNVDVDGELDIGYSSYWNSEEHGTMSKTVSGTTEDDKGEQTIETIPKEVTIDDLTDLQERVIREAAKNPDLSTSDVAERAGCSVDYPKSTLRDKCPNWYENVFKERGNSKKLGRPRKDSTDSQEDSVEQSQEVSDSELPPEVETACKALVATSENTEVVNFAEWVLEQ